jgi:hypothetical protein
LLLRIVFLAMLGFHGLIQIVLVLVVLVLSVAVVNVEATDSKEKLTGKLEAMHARQKTGWLNEPKQAEKGKLPEIKSATRPKRK